MRSVKLVGFLRIHRHGFSVTFVECGAVDIELRAVFDVVKSKEDVRDLGVRVLVTTLSIGSIGKMRSIIPIPKPSPMPPWHSQDRKAAKGNTLYQCEDPDR